MNKLFRLTVTAVVLLTVLCCFTGCQDRREPTIKEGEFPFVVEYEIDGERYVIEDTVVCSYYGYDHSIPEPFRSRMYLTHLKNESTRILIEFEENSESLMRKGRINEESRILLQCGDGDYYLNDPDGGSPPRITYNEHYKVGDNATKWDLTDLSFEELEEIFGIKIIRFEFCEPIENTFE